MIATLGRCRAGLARRRALVVLVTVVSSVLVPAGCAPARPPTLREGTMRLLEDIERTRMLLGATMWLTHDLRNFTSYEGRDVRHLVDDDVENLRLYEAIQPLDYAAASLLAAVDIGDTSGAAEDLALLRDQLGRVAPQVLKGYRIVSACHAADAERLRKRAAGGGMKLKMLWPMRWSDPVRERQREAGVQIGWRTNVDPPADFREHFWNEMQDLDIRYQLAKGRRLGVTFLVPKDPIARWDLVEPAEGKFDFTALDRTMKLAAEYGLKVRLVIPTMGGRVPDWLVAKRPQSVVPDAKGAREIAMHPQIYAHDFMGPAGKAKGPWFKSSLPNLVDEPTRRLFARYVQALADHCRWSGQMGRILTVSIEQFYADRHWRVPAGAERREFVTDIYKIAGPIIRKAFAPVPTTLEVTDGEAHGIDHDYTAHEWRSLGLTETVDYPSVASETPFFEDLMRAVALQAARKRTGKDVEAGPFFYQNCEYGFGTMLSINYFTALLRDGLWSDGWFGPEGVLRWGYFPQVFTYNDRQLQWSGILNRYLGNRQAHLLSPTLANTRVAPADAILLLPSAAMDHKGFHAHRELVGWGWALTALKVQYDVLTESALAAGGVPSRAKLLILPQAVVLGERHVAAVRQFVRGGGLLIASLVPGTDGAKPSPLADVLGADLARAGGKAVAVEQTGVKGTWLQVTVPRGMHSGKYTPVPKPDEGYPRKSGSRGGLRQAYQRLAPKGAKVVAAYGTGQPAVVLHAFGKGRAMTLGYPFGNELVFADWTSIAFGKIYNGWARDEQMLGMIRWLRDALASLGYRRELSVPEGWRYRLQGWEAAASSLSYPKGPAARTGHLAWVWTRTYMDPRPDHRIAEDHDVMDYAVELTWRDRPGVGTRFLAVGNRESAYAGERAAVQFWVMPHRLRIRIADPAIKWVYDVAARVPVRLERDGKGVSFITSVPPALGRVFAVSRTDTVEVFGAGPIETLGRLAGAARFPGVSFDALAVEVAAIGHATGQAAETIVLGTEDIHAWLAARRGKKLWIGYGEAAHKPAAEKLAGWCKKRFGIDAAATAADGKWVSGGQVAFQASFKPVQAEVLIGSAWTNNTIAAHSSMWPFNNHDAPALASGRFTATYAWPGGQRGLVALTRRREMRLANHQTFGVHYGRTAGFEPRDVDAAPTPYLRRKLLVLASTPAGAQNAVDALIAAKVPEP